MDVGLMMIFASYGWDNIGDDQVWHEDLCLRELEARRGEIGDFELNVAFRFGGIPYDKAETSLRLFAREVLPVLKSWQSPAAKAAE
jgi:hypothetical protein